MCVDVANKNFLILRPCNSAQFDTQRETHTADLSNVKRFEDGSRKLHISESSQQLEGGN